jgi:acyl-CoA oxidase
MTTPPSWVTALLPAKPTGARLLSAERASSDVDSTRLAELINGGREAIQMRERIEAAVQGKTGPGIIEQTSMSRVEKMEHSLARGKALKRMRKNLGWSDAEYNLAVRSTGEGNVYSLHDQAFMRVLVDQSTDEQKTAFLADAQADRLIGCYAQTELAHGSNVRGLETTATWDPSDKTFVIHSPEITSAKWWIGTLGRTANHAMVMAQLILDGKNMGPHTFLVPIRDTNTHELLPNVFAGDIGPKFGYK